MRRRTWLVAVCALGVLGCLAVSGGGLSDGSLQYRIGREASGGVVLLNMGRRCYRRGDTLVHTWDTAVLSGSDFTYLVSLYGTRYFERVFSIRQIQRLSCVLEHRAV